MLLLRDIFVSSSSLSDSLDNLSLTSLQIAIITQFSLEYPQSISCLPLDKPRHEASKKDFVIDERDDDLLGDECTE